MMAQAAACNRTHSDANTSGYSHDGSRVNRHNSTNYSNHYDEPSQHYDQQHARPQDHHHPPHQR